MTVLALAAAIVLQAPGPPRAHHGFRGETVVETPRSDASVHVDGRLDEPAWAQATVLTGFSQYLPVDGLPAQDSTEVLVWYTAEAIYFGIRAWDAGTVSARLSDRDNIETDDYIQILLDTFHDAQRALVFAVNALGVQADGVRQEGTGGRRRAYSGEQAEDEVDYSPDFLWDSRGAVTQDGWVAEIRIPFRSLRYQAADPQTWGIHVIRMVQRTGHVQTWAPVRRGRTSFLAQQGELRGLSGLRRGLVLDVNPVTTVRLDGTADPAGWSYAADGPEAGVNVRWGAAENLTLNGTVNPDFSQVESDAGQLVYDPRNALFFEERRPFFLEGSEHFRVPNELVYTRRIVRPDAAVKLGGKLGGTDVGLLAAADDAKWGVTGERPLFGIVRLRRDIGAGSNVGAVFTRRSEGAHYNRVVGADTRLLLGERYTLTAQGALSFDDQRAGGDAAPLFDLQLSRAGRRLGLAAGIAGKDDAFHAATGFIRRVGIVETSLRPRITLYGPRGSALESFNTSVSFISSWLYDDFWAGADVQDIKLYINNTAVLRGGWRVGLSFPLEWFAYPAYLYRDYALQRPGSSEPDTIPFEGGERINNAAIVFTLVTPEWERFSASATLIGGREINFDEWSDADVVVADITVGWRPTEQLRTELLYAHQRYIRHADRSRARTRDIPRAKVEYQLSRALFVRFVGQYTAYHRDALRDYGRTGLPILVRSGAGVYEPALEIRDNQLRTDWLVSFEPSPGTVVYGGYGSTLVEESAFGFRGMQRTVDGFFVKLSYLFRF